MIRFFLLSIFILPLSTIAQVKENYSIFTGDGKTASYEKMVSALSKAEVVFFGELHDNALAHWLELQLLKDLYALNNQVTLGMEMFESDDQIIIDEYIDNLIEEKQLLAEAKLWDNYKTDYRPLVDFARQKKIPIIATNVPRRYANMVYRKGVESLDSLQLESKKWMTPLPLQVDYSLTSYKSMMEQMGQHGSGSGKNLVASQALKDATMAHFIAMHQKKGNRFFHVNGAYHTQDYQGIITYFLKLKPDLKIVSVHVAEQTSINTLDSAHHGKADFILCIVDDMTKSY
ncbi:ChaN family lipoprotein [Chryseolinea sp. H1M3-3]|uniref:ChaN family lipoprotein n=1 Tax=Chryseolinea sp. H1M3-3 TaxID=3034144 RepID=UPI0023EC824E|nr:ChaN family lipoprotein [Chryseolinea sp. H1M3-3]